MVGYMPHDIRFWHPLDPAGPSLVLVVCGPDRLVPEPIMPHRFFAAGEEAIVNCQDHINAIVDSFIQADASFEIDIDNVGVFGWMISDAGECGISQIWRWSYLNDGKGAGSGHSSSGHGGHGGPSNGSEDAGHGGPSWHAGPRTEAMFPFRSPNIAK